MDKGPNELGRGSVSYRGSVVLALQVFRSNHQIRYLYDQVLDLRVVGFGHMTSISEEGHSRDFGMLSGLWVWGLSFGMFGYDMFKDFDWFMTQCNF